MSEVEQLRSRWSRLDPRMSSLSSLGVVTDAQLSQDTLPASEKRMSLPHCSSKCATSYEDLLPFCPLSVHTVLKADEEGWAAVDQSVIYDVSADVDTAYSSKSGNGLEFFKVIRYATWWNKVNREGHQKPIEEEEE
nr:hypothetical protein JCGZ_22892 [Tanacetum cinerariifolium]